TPTSPRNAITTWRRFRRSALGSIASPNNPAMCRWSSGRRRQCRRCKSSLGLDAGVLDDRPPFVDLRLLIRRKRRRALLLAGEDRVGGWLGGVVGGGGGTPLLGPPHRADRPPVLASPPWSTARARN